MLTSNYVKCFMLCNYMTVCKHLYPSLHILLFLMKRVRGDGYWISVQRSAGGHTLRLFHCSCKIPNTPAGSVHFKGSRGGRFSSSDNFSPVKKGKEGKKKKKKKKRETQQPPYFTTIQKAHILLPAVFLSMNLTDFCI